MDRELLSVNPFMGRGPELLLYANAFWAHRRVPLLRTLASRERYRPSFVPTSVHQGHPPNFPRGANFHSERGHVCPIFPPVLPVTLLVTRMFTTPAVFLGSVTLKLRCTSSFSCVFLYLWVPPQITPPLRSATPHNFRQTAPDKFSGHLD